MTAQASSVSDAPHAVAESRLKRVQSRPVLARPGALALQWATVRVLLGRDVVRFFRQPSRVVGALAQPVLFWWVASAGFSGSFQVQGARGLDYQRFSFPGVVAMVQIGRAHV